VFEHLKGFDVILVSGPQRSGTTICSKMVAADTGHTLIPESEFDFHDEALFRAIVTAGGKSVVHCPPMAHLLHEFADDDGVAIVFMVRDVRDIIASQERINWTAKEEVRELTKYGAHYGPISLVKYDYWSRVQRDRIPEGQRFEVEYESLSKHPLWEDRPGRGQFGYRP